MFGAQEDPRPVKRRLESSRALGPRTRGLVAAGAVGGAIGIGGVIAAAALPLTGDPSYVPMVGAVAIAVWLAGAAGGAAAVLSGWTVALWALSSPRWSFALDSRDDLMRWATALLVGVVVAGVGRAMRRGHERAAGAAVRAEDSHRRVERVQELAAALSAAVTPEDVARVMVEGVPATIGARGGAFGVIEGDALVIVDPAGASGQTLTPGSRIPLTTRAPIAAAARDGVPVWVQRRREFAHRFPDGAALAPYASGALAVPVRVGGNVVGAMGFPFTDSRAITEEVRAIAAIAADLGGQALERAGLYAQERSSREGLDRILTVAPRFQEGATPEQVAESVCAEARRTFECDVAQIWTPIDDESLEVTWRDPPATPIPAGTRIAFADLPGLIEEMSALRTMFVLNVQEQVQGEALNHARQVGVFSSLRVPIVIGGRFERILVLQWERIVAELPPATLALARRYADQVGLAIEQAGRRRAQEETRRLQAVTEALAGAATPIEVGETIVHQGAAALWARAATVHALQDDAELRLLAANGYAPEVLDTWRAIPIETGSPIADAAREREVIACETRDEIAARYPDLGALEEALVAAPLVAGGRVVGAIMIASAEPMRYGAFELGLVLGLARQAAQALDRALLFEREQASATRMRRLQEVTAALSQAVTVEDVSQTCLERGAAAIGADAGAVALRPPGSAELEIVHSFGYELGESRARIPLDAAVPVAEAVRIGRPVWALTETEVARYPAAHRLGTASRDRGWIALPLLGGELPAGALLFTFREPRELSADDREWLQTLASQCAQALDRAGRYETERAIAETLQRSILPGRLPDLDGVSIAARYMPGTAGVDVGGDWYDAIELDDGLLGLVVGDVVGKGVRAAATMGQLRNGLRAFAFEHVNPEAAVSRLNRLVDGLADAPFATLAYVVLDPVARTCRYVIAGHPPPLLRGADGAALFLGEGRALPLGVDRDATFEAGAHELDPGSTLVLYTDGLVERRDRPLDDGLEELRRATERGPDDPDSLVDMILAEAFTGDQRGDDVAILAVRLTAQPVQLLRLTLPARPAGLSEMRASLRRWLAAAGVGSPDADDIVLATWEACANAVEHAQEPVTGTFEIEALHVGAERIRVRVRDTGRWKTHGNSADRGLGLTLMRALMHRVEITPGAGGTVVVMERGVTAGAVGLVPADRG